MADQPSRYRHTLPLSLAILPPVFILFSIIRFGVDTPQWDEWVLAGYVAKLANGTLSFSDLVQPQNEYIQFFPNLILVSLGWWSGLDMRWAMIFSLVFACLTSFNIYHLIKASFTDQPQYTSWIYLLANLIIFSPVQHENWLQGQQLIYFLPAACFTGGLLIALNKNLRPTTRFVLCALLCIVSSFSSANGMLCWLLLLPILAGSSKAEFWRNRWWIIAWAFGFILTGLIYFKSSQPLSQDTQLGFSHTSLQGVVLYFLAILGRPLAPGRLIPVVTTGLVLLLAFIWCVVRFWRRDKSFSRSLMLCWLMIGAYSLATAALITVGRAGQFSGQHLPANRYTTFAIFLSIALVVLVPLVTTATQPARKTTRLLAVLAMVLVVMHIGIYLLGIRQMSSFNVLARQAKACAEFVNVLEQLCLTEKISPHVYSLKANINAVDRLGFLRPRLIRSNRILDLQTESQSTNAGAFETLQRLDSGDYFASGWALLPSTGNPADAVLLVQEQPGQPALVFEFGWTGTERDFVSSWLRRGTLNHSRWTATFRLANLGTEQTKVTAWGFDATTGKAYKLLGEFPLQQR